ncbi:AAA family ATPase [Methylosinus sp. Ce-a6]|uniref:AAA family ATPase n=1 Tax=Methylosinus sp. Ce-a6 TaxID=2172005 RepID=UPI001357362D|nr:AAA family ATPase [Methylosinus sp. Ce-a6]
MFLVTGVSGVGKTYTINAARQLRRNYGYARASELLLQLGRPIQNLSPNEAIENQRALIDEMVGLDAHFGGRLIFDGHAMIETGKGPLPVWPELGTQLPLDAIIAIVDDPGQIAIRRVEKGKRNSEVEVSVLQDIEIAASREWACISGVPLAIIQSGDVQTLIREFDRIKN